MKQESSRIGLVSCIADRLTLQSDCLHDDSLKSALNKTRKKENSG